ncbi:hypothetical protein [Bacillus sp. ISTL8]|uniref:hypothetical protein n=1 Tax=unclassified Bacillus (in: firmicutes) TaxID=185979 RepID=UPI00145680C4|nr:hypothetical protein [Bacillus sp. ISTL8]
MEIKKEMLINAIKEMKDAERRVEILEKMIEIKKEIHVQKQNLRNLSEYEQDLWFGKLALIELIEDEHITNPHQMEKWLQIIETVCKFDADDTLEFGHALSFEYDIMIISSWSKDCLIETRIGFRDGELLMNRYENKVDSIETILNTIHENLVNAQREREEKLKEPSTSTIDGDMPDF